MTVVSAVVAVGTEKQVAQQISFSFLTDLLDTKPRERNEAEPIDTKLIGF